LSTRLQALATLAAAILMLPLLQACGDWEPPRGPGATAVVVGGRSNMPAPSLAGGAREALETAFLSQDMLFIVEVSGRPRERYREPLSHNCSNPPTCRGAVRSFQQKIDALVAAVAAGREEADTLGAILVAAGLLAGVDIDGPRQIVVIDNGLQTTGAMPLHQPGALFADPELVVEPWLADGMLVDLDGVEVLLTGLGATYEPQAELPLELVDALTELWTTVLAAAGARVRVDSIGLPEHPPAQGLPQVTPVTFHEVLPTSVEACVRLRADQVGFVANMDTFLDAARTREVLTPYAEEIIAKGMSVTVIGTTALEETSSPPLSRRRAEAVVRVLRDLGVPRNLMVAAGVGTDFVGYVPPFDSRDNFVETIAVQNRLVFIQPIGLPCTAEGEEDQS
jgi:hypothetical protein